MVVVRHVSAHPCPHKHACVHTLTHTPTQHACAHIHPLPSPPLHTLHTPSHGMPEYRCPREVSTALCIHDVECIEPDCSGHGSCELGLCSCDPPWIGEGCERLNCSMMDCNNRGECTEEGRWCVCVCVCVCVCACARACVRVCWGDCFCSLQASASVMEDGWENSVKNVSFLTHNHLGLVLASFPDRYRLQFLITCSMQKRRGKAWEKESHA